MLLAVSDAGTCSLGLQLLLGSSSSRQGAGLLVLGATVSAEECQLVNQAYPGDQVEDPHRCRVDSLRGGGWPDDGYSWHPRPGGLETRSECSAVVMGQGWL